MLENGGGCRRVVSLSNNATRQQARRLLAAFLYSNLSWVLVFGISSPAPPMKMEMQVMQLTDFVAVSVSNKVANRVSSNMLYVPHGRGSSSMLDLYCASKWIIVVWDVVMSCFSEYTQQHFHGIDRLLEKVWFIMYFYFCSSSTTYVHGE